MVKGALSQGVLQFLGQSCTARHIHYLHVHTVPLQSHTTCFYETTKEGDIKNEF